MHMYLLIYSSLKKYLDTFGQLTQMHLIAIETIYQWHLQDDVGLLLFIYFCIYFKGDI